MEYLGQVANSHSSPLYKVWPKGVCPSLFYVGQLVSLLGCASSQKQAVSKGHYYLTAILCLWEVIRHKRSQLFESGSLQNKSHDNVLAHASGVIQDFLMKHTIWHARHYCPLPNMFAATYSLSITLNFPDKSPATYRFGSTLRFPERFPVSFSYFTRLKVHLKKWDSRAQKTKD